MAAKIDSARRATMVGGGVGPSSGSYAPPPPQPEPPPHYQYQQQPDRGYAPAPRRSAALAVRPETRALVALGYPFWPLALLALLDSKGSHFVRRQAWQALGFNFGMYGLGAALTAIAGLPLIGMSAWPLLPFIVPVAIVANIVYAWKVWNGDDVNVPLVSDWVDARLPA